VEHRLPGWRLVWLRLSVADGGAAGAARARASRLARTLYEAGSLTEVPIVAALRRLFREAGTDPTRYRPSSEALLRRLAKGEELPAIHPLVDVNNCVSVALAAPCCVMAEGSIDPVVTLRRGEAGERMESLRGPFDLTGKPLLADGRGPFGTPITDSTRVAVHATTTDAWMVVYLPAGTAAERVAETFAELGLDAVATASEPVVTGD
jgi:DNA/RNA-binding domain of Phe-tRNA-synthetase-like protein